jgi:hypothetical protein
MLDVQGQGAGEPVPLAGHVHGETAAIRVVPPPLEQPAVQQERARPAHREDERVPLLAERGELVRLGDGADGGHDPSRR